MLAIIDYKIGNIGSLVNAFNCLNTTLEIVSEPTSIHEYEGIILPGVGAFDTAMDSLHKTGFADEIKKFVASGKPILGICLGLQIMCSGSDEGSEKGLGLIDARITSLSSMGCQGKIPHVGFNEITNSEKNNFMTSSSSKDFYFVHSFALGNINSNNENILCSWTEYEGAKFISAFQVNNIFATQFHPEKSGEAGIKLLSEFISCSKNV